VVDKICVGSSSDCHREWSDGGAFCWDQEVKASVKPWSQVDDPDDSIKRGSSYSTWKTTTKGYADESWIIVDFELLFAGWCRQDGDDMLTKVRSNPYAEKVVMAMFVTQAGRQPASQPASQPAQLLGGEVRSSTQARSSRSMLAP
jgi:hypothetical protein